MKTARITEENIELNRIIKAYGGSLDLAVAHYERRLAEVVARARKERAK